MYDRKSYATLNLVFIIDDNYTPLTGPKSNKYARRTMLLFLFLKYSLYRCEILRPYTQRVYVYLCICVCLCNLSRECPLAFRRARMRSVHAHAINVYTHASYARAQPLLKYSINTSSGVDVFSRRGKYVAYCKWFWCLFCVDVF